MASRCHRIQSNDHDIIIMFELFKENFSFRTKQKQQSCSLNDLIALNLKESKDELILIH